MEHAINWLSEITYKSEIIPPSCFRKKAGGGLIRPSLRSRTRLDDPETK